ncbi:hypothetical protein C8R43DRAFT_2246 [Mycena crocata]|nr:hypothetical protein C8R43DRAFT_2246 [Mycena crocata]
MIQLVELEAALFVWHPGALEAHQCPRLVPFIFLSLLSHWLVLTAASDLRYSWLSAPPCYEEWHYSLWNPVEYCVSIIAPLSPAHRLSSPRMRKYRTEGNGIGELRFYQQKVLFIMLLMVELSVFWRLPKERSGPLNHQC